MKKTAGCLYNMFYGSILLISIFACLLVFALIGGNAVLMAVPCFAVFYFCYIKLTIRKIHHYLCKPGKRFMSWVNLLACFIFFNAVVIASAFYLINITKGGMTDTNDHSFIQMLAVIAKALCWFIASMVLWAHFSNVLILGIESFPKKLFMFTVKYVPLYLVYQVAAFLVLLVGHSIISLASGGENVLMSMGFSYFLFDCTPSDINVSGLVGNLTSSSSYVVLGAMMLEFLKRDNEETFVQRVKAMFLNQDTIRLLVMTVICIIATLVTTGAVSLRGFSIAGGIPKEATATIVVLAVLYIAWIVSAISFVKSTNLLTYFSALITMIFIEVIVPIPEITIKTFVIAIICILLRIVLFVTVAMLSAVLEKAFEDHQGISTVEVSPETQAAMKSTANAVLYAIERKKAFDSAIDKMLKK